MRAPASSVATDHSGDAHGADAGVVPPLRPVHERLRCLATLYDAQITTRDGRDGLLAAELFVPWDDGRRKTPAERLAGPSLSDIFVPPYRREPPAKVSIVDHDPGRVRVESLLRQAYGRDAESVQRSLVRLPLRRNQVSVHRRAAEAFRAVFSTLEKLASADPMAARYVDTLGGTYNHRNIAGTQRLSAHAFGIAIDLNPALAQYHLNQPGGVWRTPVPEAIVEAFESHGFAWGGRWYHDDTMHFEFRPELFDARCTGETEGGAP